MTTDNEYSFLFVFYDGIYHKITNLPGEWNCIDSTVIPPINETITTYTHYAYYKGPTETKAEAEKDLDEKLRIAIDMSAIKSYHIQNTFLPVPV